MTRSWWIFLLAPFVTTQNTSDYRPCVSNLNQVPLLNASGTVLFKTGAQNLTTGFPGPGQPINFYTAGWAYTVTNGSVDNSTQTTQQWWYNSFGVNMNNDLGIQFDACAMLFVNMPENTNARGAHDSGDCVDTLGDNCVTALQDAASVATNNLVGSFTPPPYSNLSNGSFPQVCDMIYSQVTLQLSTTGNEVNKQCAPFFNFTDGDPGGIALPLTAPNASLGQFISTPCWTSREWYPVYRKGCCRAGNWSGLDYDTVVRQVTPILTVYMPPANYQRQTWYSPMTTMSCTRAQDFIKGSRVVPELPAPTPVRHGVNASSKAGIVVGSIVGAGLIAGLLVGWHIRRRRVKRRAVADAEFKVRSSDIREVDGRPVAEIEGKSRPWEAEDTEIYEMLGDGNERVELPNRSAESQLN